MQPPLFSLKTFPLSYSSVRDPPRNDQKFLQHTLAIDPSSRYLRVEFFLACIASPLLPELFSSGSADQASPDPVVFFLQWRWTSVPFTAVSFIPACLFYSWKTFFLFRPLRPRHQAPRNHFFMILKRSSTRLLSHSNRLSPPTFLPPFGNTILKYTMLVAFQPFSLFG